MAQQTAVQYLRRMYDEQHGQLYGEDFEQAEQIEKGEIIDACNMGIDLESHLLINDGEDYYNQTFNKNKVN